MNNYYFLLLNEIVFYSCLLFSNDNNRVGGLSEWESIRIEIELN